jgi:two-component system, NtrC family, sensor histidine kinase HydH
LTSAGGRFLVCVPAVNLHAILDLVACAGHLVVVSLALIRQTGSPLALPLGLLALNLFSWNFADFSYTVSGQLAWHLVDLGLSPFSPALAFQLVMTFVGGVRRYRWLVVASYLFFGALASTAWLAFAFPSAMAWTTSGHYAVTFLVAEAVLMTFSLGLLVLHVRRTSDLAERARGRTMIAAILLGGVIGTADLWDDIGAAIPPMSNIGTTVCALLMMMASLKLRLLGRAFPRRVAGAALAMTLVALGSYLAVFRWLSGNNAILMAVTATMTLTLVAAGRHLGKEYMARRDKVEGLTILGRFSAQMAHDLKNPLAALKGAIQFLGEEVSRGHSVAEQGKFLALLLQQVDRINRVVDDYQRLGNLQPHPRPVQLNDTVREVLALQSFAAKGILVETALDEQLPLCSVDADLMSRALENLVRNAVEALPGGGSVCVRTTTLGSRAYPNGVQVAVQDSGRGMDARQAERAFDEFFTTKVNGSGLGLAFVRRVVRAHAGRVKIDSSLGRGTLVTMRFPVR